MKSFLITIHVTLMISPNLQWSRNGASQKYLRTFTAGSRVIVGVSGLGQGASLFQSWFFSQRDQSIFEIIQGKKCESNLIQVLFIPGSSRLSVNSWSRIQDKPAAIEIDSVLKWSWFLNPQTHFCIKWDAGSYSNLSAEVLTMLFQVLRTSFMGLLLKTVRRMVCGVLRTITELN